MTQFSQLKPLTIKSHGVRLPTVIIDKDDKEKYGIKDSDSSDEIVRNLSYKGLSSRIISGEIDESRVHEYVDKIEYELKILAETKFSAYIVLVWDSLNCARKKGIPLGSGRGSSGSSLVNFLLYITDIDPIVNGLFFERFISKSRAKITMVDDVPYFDGSLLPDIDTDICHERRHEVIELLQKKYNGKFCKLSTLSTLQSKSLIKDVAKCVEGFSEEQAKAVSDTIPTLFGRVFDLDEANESSEDFREFAKTHEKIYSIAKKLHGLPKSFGSHASAFLVCYDELDDFMPCQMGTDNEVITSLDMNFAQMSAIKLDLLGLQAVSLIDAVSHRVGIDHNKIGIESYEDIYSHLKDLQYPYGLFQISGDCNYRVVKDIMPKNVDQLSAVVAIARPGALAYLKDYAHYSNTGEAGSVHEFFDDVLSQTGGLPLYQEQTLAMMVKMGFSAEDAESLRKIIGKKLKDKIKEWEPKVFDKIKEKGLDPKIGEIFFSLANSSADYSFNKSICVETKIQTTDDTIQAKSIKVGDFILAYDTQSSLNHYVKVLEIYNHHTELWAFEFNTGAIIECSMKHKFLCEDLKMRPIEDIIDKKLRILCRSGLATVSYYESIGIKPALDFKVDHIDHNFYANGLVCSNSHSCAYATTAAKLIYLKFKYPKEFYLECLKIAQHKADSAAEIGEISKEMKMMGLPLLPPDIMKSSMEFKIEGDGIRFSLASIKGVAEKAISKLMKFINSESDNKFEIFESSKQAKLNIGIFSALIQAGAIASVSEDRAKTVLEAQIWGLLTDREKRFCLQNGHKYNFDLLSMLKDYESWLTETGAKMIKDSRIETIRKKSHGYVQIYKQNSEYKHLSSYFYENKLLGYSYTSSLKDIFNYKNEDLVDVKQLKNNRTDGDGIEFVGKVIEARKGVSKKGDDYIKMTLSDEYGNFDFMLFGKDCQKYEKEGGTLPQEGQILYCSGRMGKDMVWLKKMSVQDYKIYSRLAEMKNDE